MLVETRKKAKILREKQMSTSAYISIPRATLVRLEKKSTNDIDNTLITCPKSSQHLTNQTLIKLRMPMQDTYLEILY